VQIELPFQSQSPYRDWTPLHEEACEEASYILVKTFLQGKTSLSADEMEWQIQELVVWHREAGYADDVSVTDLLKMLQAKEGVTGRVLTDVTVDDLRRELAAGRLVIAPFAGRELGNPYFSGEGPWYHMLVITGYRPGVFVTHDVGTRRGEDYVYDADVLFAALHDWTGIKEETRLGAKNVLVIDAL
jgi:hypothetical protein